MQYKNISKNVITNENERYESLGLSKTLSKETLSHNLKKTKELDRKNILLKDGNVI